MVACMGFNSYIRPYGGIGTVVVAVECDHPTLIVCCDMVAMPRRYGHFCSVSFDKRWGKSGNAMDGRPDVD